MRRGGVIPTLNGTGIGIDARRRPEGKKQEGRSGCRWFRSVFPFSIRITRLVMSLPLASTRRSGQAQYLSVMLDLTLLRRHPMLTEASDTAIDLIGRHGVLRRWTARQVIFRRGDPAYGIVLLLSGRVRVIRERDGRRQVLHIEETGGTLGEIPIFDHGLMPATAVAADVTEGVVLSPDLVAAVIRHDPAVVLAFLRRMAGRVRNMADRLERMTLHGVGMRLATALLERARRAPGHPISFGMSQEQFAEELGTVREVLVRELRGLVQARILTPLGSGRYALLHPEALGRIAVGQPWNLGP